MSGLIAHRGLVLGSRQRSLVESVIDLLAPYCWYRLNDVAPGGIVTDSSGNGWHGTYSDTVQVGDAVSSAGSSLKALGKTTNGSFSFPSDGWTMGADSATGYIAVMCIGPLDSSLEVPSNAQYVIGKGAASSGPIKCGFVIDQNATHSVFNPSTSAGTSGRPQGSHTATEAHVIAYAYRTQESGRVRAQFYVDGSAVTTGNSTYGTALTKAVGETWRGGAPDQYPTSYGRRCNIADIMMTPGYSDDTTEAAAMKKLYELLAA
jgi:hypothetical protein